MNYQQNPYAPPQAAPPMAQAAMPAAGAPQPWTVGEVLSIAWERFKPNWVVLVFSYFIAMIIGSLGYRLPAQNWRPAGWQPPAATKAKALVTTRSVDLNVASRTPQFWLVWWVLALNVTAGIGIIGMASPLLQEVFGGRLIGVQAAFDQLTAQQHSAIAALAAGFTGLLSLFNIAGRFFWASASDYIGRKPTYMVFLLLGLVLYASIPSLAAAGNLALFVGFFCIILSMYGGGFSTVPAYLADLFGTRMVGAIHGRLLTAWSAAGILGPVIVNYIREYQLAHHVARAQAYSVTMYVLAALLALGFLCNLMIRPVADKYYMTPAQLAALDAADKSMAAASTATVVASSRSTAGWQLAAAWIAVGIPIAWGVWVTLQKAVVLFGF